MQIQDYAFPDLGSPQIWGVTSSSPGGGQGEHPSLLSEGQSPQSPSVPKDEVQDLVEGHMQGVQ